MCILFCFLSPHSAQAKTIHRSRFYSTHFAANRKAKTSLRDTGGKVPNFMLFQLVAPDDLGSLSFHVVCVGAVDCFSHGGLVVMSMPRFFHPLLRDCFSPFFFCPNERGESLTRSSREIYDLRLPTACGFPMPSFIKWQTPASGALANRYN